MRLALLLFFICLTVALTAQTTLTSGDLAVVGYSATDSPDEICLVALAPIEIGTVINVTDNGWTGSALRTTEGVNTITFTEALTFGDTYCFEASGQLNLNDTGDQIFLFTGTLASPTFIYALQFREDDWLISGPADAGSSYQPAGTVDGNTAFNIGNSTARRNSYYSGPALVDKATALMAISDASNWTGLNVRLAPSENLAANLPVTLTNLTAVPMGKTAMVKWSTATESGNSHFVVERSQGGGSFTAVGRVDGAGDSNGTINYDFVDQAPTNGDNYYRLRQVDLTGETTVFGPVMVSFDADGLTAYPNPVSDRLYVSGAAATSRTTILDLNGRVMSTSINAGNGIATDNLASGTYLLRVESAAGTETLRFVKQ